jgi:hypothetical protein
MDIIRWSLNPIDRTAIEFQKVEIQPLDQYIVVRENPEQINSPRSRQGIHLASSRAEGSRPTAVFGPRGRVGQCQSDLSILLPVVKAVYLYRGYYCDHRVAQLWSSGAASPFSLVLHITATTEAIIVHCEATSACCCGRRSAGGAGSGRYTPAIGAGPDESGKVTVTLSKAPQAWGRMSRSFDRIVIGRSGVFGG